MDMLHGQNVALYLFDIAQDINLHAGASAISSSERAALSRQERDEILRHRISYLETDLVVPTWNAAFVYDTPAGAQASLEIVEFANCQLLQFRYYDERSVENQCRGKAEDA